MSDRSEKVNALLKQIEEGTKAVFESENYKSFLKAMSRFHQYSFRNCLLIVMQKPDATRVASFTTWKKLDRYVKRGETGIAILGWAPRKVHKEEPLKDKDGNTVYDSDGKPKLESVEHEIPSYRPVYVYDVSQTGGKPLPELVHDLKGEVNDYHQLMQAFKDISPFPIRFVEATELQKNAKGCCDPMNQEILIRRGMDQTQSVKTVVHEVSHAMIHAPEFELPIEKRTDQRTREVQAESTAFLVCEHYGIDTSEYTFPYLTSWSRDKKLEELQNSLEQIKQTSEAIIDAVDKNMKERNSEKQLGVFGVPDASLTMEDKNMKMFSMNRATFKNKPRSKRC